MPYCARTLARPLRSPLLLLAASLSLLAIGWQSGVSRPPARDAQVKRRAAQAFSTLPLQFEPRPGKPGAAAEFVSRGPGYSLLVRGPETFIAVSPAGTPEKKGQPSIVTMKLAGANPRPRAAGLERLPTKLNYFLGDDPKQWRTGIHPYGKVKYAGVYPGVDLVYYGNQRQLEYDLVVQPGADPDPIALDFSGAEEVHLDPATGDLVLRTAAGELRQHRPIAYQEIQGKRVPIPARFLLSRGSEFGPQRAVHAVHEVHSVHPVPSHHPPPTTQHLTPPSPTHPHTHTPAHVTFALAPYDRSRRLVIDPVLAYGTYLGGSSDDIVTGMVCDDGGNAYLVGQTPSVDFPVTPGSYQDLSNGASDVFVSQINTLASGAASLVFSTYLGGSGGDAGLSIARSSDGTLSISGATDSTGFPTTPTALQRSRGGGSDGFFARLDPAASGAAFLQYSTYLGGTGSEVVNGMALDSAGVTYLGGRTDSALFPHVTPSAVQRLKASGQDAFLVKLDPRLSGASGLLYGTFLGAEQDDTGIAVAADEAGTAYLAGATSSVNFPTSGDPFRATDPADGNWDGFLARIETTTSGIGGLSYSTYLGGNAYDLPQALAIDARGRVYLGGLTTSTNFPTTTTALSRLYSGDGSGLAQNAFFCRLDPTLPGSSALLYSTYLNLPQGSARSNVRALALTSAGTVWICGGVYGSFPLTGDAFQKSSCGGYLAHLDPSLAGSDGLLYSSYVGGPGDFSVPAGGAADAYAVALDANGAVYVASVTFSDAFAITATACQPQRKAGRYEPGLQKFVPNPPLAPSAVQATAVPGRKINVSWTDNSSNESGFRIQRKSGSDGFASVGTVGANTSTFQDSGLVAGTQYTYRVQTFNAGGDSAFSGLASATAVGDLPAVPSDLAVVSVGPTQVSLAWTDKSADESSFEIERKTGTGSFVPIGSVGANTAAYVDLTVQPKTAYGYRVRAVNPVGPSAYSNDVAVTTPPLLPAAPSELQATPRLKTEIGLTWKDNSGNLETEFRIERKTGADPFQQVGTAAGNTTSYVDKSCQPDTSYTYRLRAANADGASEPSNEAAARTPSPAAPDAPSDLTATAVSRSGVELVFIDNSADEIGFKVERKTGITGFTVVATAPLHSGTGTAHFRDESCLPSTEYVYRVRATSPDGDSGYTNEAKATTLPDPPAPPTLSAILAGLTSARLTWTDVTTEDSYRIERKAGSDTYQLLSTQGANTTSYLDSTLAPSTTYTYRVFAINVSGPSASSNETQVSTPVTPPTAPSNLQAYVAASRQVGLLWQDGSTNETGFAIERKEGTGEFAPLIQVGPNVESYADRAVQTGTTYVYRVQAVNAGGGSDYATSNAVTTPGADDQRPVAPLGFRAVGLADRIRLSWDYRGTGQTGFLLERGTVLGTYSSLTVVGASARSYDDRDGLQANTTYFYQVRALGPGGQSDPARADARLGGGGLLVSPSGNTPLDFGAIRRGTTRTRTVTILNQGTASATVQIRKPSSPFRIVAPTSPLLKVPGGTTKTVTVQFKPAKKGTFAGTLTLRWVEQDKNFTVKLQGKGL